MWQAGSQPALIQGKLAIGELPGQWKRTERTGY